MLNITSNSKDKKIIIENKGNEIQLDITCNGCINSKKPETYYKNNLKCLECIICSLINIKNENLEIKINNNQIPNHDLEYIIEIKNIFQHYKKLENEFYSISCKYKFNCRLFKNFITSIEKNLLKNCLLSFFNVNDVNLIQKLNNNSIQCRKCYAKYVKKIENYYREIRKTKIYRILKFNKTYTLKELLNYIFLGFNIDNSNFIVIKKKQILLHTYQIEGYPLFLISIYHEPNSIEKVYKVTKNIGDKPIEIYQKIIEVIKSKLIKLDFQQILHIGDLLKKYIQTAKNELKINFPNLTTQEIDNLSVLTAIKVVRLEKIFPLLIDKNIEEIYLDNPNSSLYIDHQLEGRCNTDIFLDNLEIESLKTFLRVASNKRMDFSNPSLKCTIQNDFFKCRFSVDSKPLTSSGFALDIRKMSKKTFTLPELIFRNMLSSKMAAFLYYCLINRMNITVVGETSTGKTTLINSLDLLVPKHYRKIYIEEAPESLNLYKFGIHQLKYIVNSDSKQSSILNKTQQIYTLLHRNPDYIYLGEILNKEEANAMFHCLSAGLRGLQTIHARDLSSLVNRWRFHFKINESCFNDLDILILLRRIGKWRFVQKISEILVTGNNITVKDIFIYDFLKEKWIQCEDFLKTNVIKKLVLKKNEILDIERIIEFITQIFNELSNKKDFNIESQLDLFEKITYELISNKNENKPFNINNFLNLLKDYEGE
ncbi:MAG: ATPase, T2SS/T4P/T4SS family [Promethearchaeota archaeon]